MTKLGKLFSTRSSISLNSPVIAEFLLLTIGLIASKNNCVNGSLTVKPVSTEVVVGQSTRLYCSTSDGFMEVHWQHMPYGNTTYTYIYYNKKIVNGYNTRFSVDEDQTSGKYDLVIENAQMADAGTYRCHERVGSGEHMDVELIVLKSEPKCKATDLSFCNKESQTFDISCSIKYAGRIRPDVDCNSSKISTSSVILTEDLPQRVGYKIHSIARWPGTDHLSVRCQTKLSSISSTIGVNAPYAFDSTSSANVSFFEPVECKANSTSQCSYSWNDTKTGTKSSHQKTLKTNATGKHECIAECHLQTQSPSYCSVRPMAVHVTVREYEHSSSQISTTILGLIIVAVVIFILIAAVGLTLIWFFVVKKRRLSKTKGQTGTRLCWKISPQSSQSSDSSEKPLNENGGHYSDCPA